MAVGGTQLPNPISLLLWPPDLWPRQSGRYQNHHVFGYMLIQPKQGHLKAAHEADILVRILFKQFIQC